MQQSTSVYSLVGDIYFVRSPGFWWSLSFSTGTNQPAGQVRTTQTGYKSTGYETSSGIKVLSIINVCFYETKFFETYFSSLSWFRSNRLRPVAFILFVEVIKLTCIIRDKV